MRTGRLSIALAVLILGSLRSVAAESSYSMSEKDGPMVSWRVVTGRSATAPATTGPTTAGAGSDTTYSLYDPATQQYQVVTDPAVIADLARRTAAMEAQDARVMADFRLTPEQRAAAEREKYMALAAQMPQREVAHDAFRRGTGIVRGLLGLVVLVISVAGWIQARAARRRLPPKR